MAVNYKNRIEQSNILILKDIRVWHDSVQQSRLPIKLRRYTHQTAEVPGGPPDTGQYFCEENMLSVDPERS